MKRRLPKITAIILSVMFCVMVFGGCNGDSSLEDNEDLPSVSQGETNTEIPEENKNPTAPTTPTTPTKPEDKVHEHSLVHAEFKAATCTSAGNIEYWHCSVCGNDYSDGAATTQAENTSIPIAEHNYTETVVAPTCTDKGHTEYTCTECGDTYRDKETDAVGHNYTETIIEPTCEKAGYTAYKCSTCGDTYRDNEAEAKGHNYTETIIDPTCDKKGYTKHTCTVCGDTYTSNEIEALGHNYAETIIAPTCDKSGYTVHTCTICGNTYTDNEIAARGHKYTETVVYPTCENGGYTEYECSACGDKYTGNETSALGHDYAETVIGPTCTEKGYTKHECGKCGDTYTDNEIAPTGHEYAEAWSSDNEFHWHEVLCGCDIEPTKQAHDIANEECSICGRTFWAYRLIIVDNVVTGIEIAEGVDEIELEIPGGVVEIGDEAFRGRAEITSIIIPESVKRIGANAFTGSGLKKATIRKASGWTIVPPKGASTNFTWGSATLNAGKLVGLGDSYLTRK